MPQLVHLVPFAVIIEEMELGLWIIPVPGLIKRDISAYPECGMRSGDNDQFGFIYEDFFDAVVSWAIFIRAGNRKTSSKAGFLPLARKAVFRFNTQFHDKPMSKNTFTCS